MSTPMVLEPNTKCSGYYRERSSDIPRFAFLLVDPYLCSGAGCEGGGVKGKPATRGLSPMARWMTQGNARSGGFETGSWEGLEL